MKLGSGPALAVALVASAGLARGDSESSFEERALGSIPKGLQVGRAIAFSPDGKRVAFVGTKDGKCVPVVDGKAFEAKWFVHTPSWSSVGRVAFRIVEEPKKRTHVSWVLLDGKRLPDSDGVLLLEWSPDGRRLAFARYPECRIADDRSREGDCVLVVDGKAGGKRNVIHEAAWSADSKHLAAIAEEWTKKSEVVHSVFVDGEPIASGSIYDGAVFSPDGTRVAFAAVAPRKDVPNPGPDDLKWFVQCGDARLGLEFDAAGSPLFSPGGARVAFKALKDGRVGLSVDGGKPAADHLFVASYAWSPDGAHLAAVVSDDCTVPPGGRVTRSGESFVRDGKWRLALDGKPVGDEYAAIDALVFSSDSKRLAARVRDGDAWRVVCGAWKSPPFDFVGPPVLSPSRGTPTKVAFGALSGRDFVWKVMEVD